MRDLEPWAWILADACAGGRATRVLFDPAGELPLHALELRSRLALLAEERLAAREAGIGDTDAYTADLNAEVDETQYVHTGAVVLQLALLRAEIGRRTLG